MKAQDLKNSILQLAIQGKLVAQDANDEPAELLYAKIQTEKQKLIKEGKIKKDKPLPPITEDEIPFDIPPSWKWVRLGDIGDYKKGPFGSSLTKDIFSDKGIKVYEQKNAIKKDATLGNYYITEEYFNQKMKSFEVCSGDIIVSCAGTIGETYVMPNDIEKGIINQALMRIRLSKFINIDYYLQYFDFILKSKSQKYSNGCAIKNIPPFEIFKNLLIPLPPLAEQKRIVAKIEELEPLVKQYDKAETELSVLNDSFPEQLQKSILQYAIQGKLVPQDVNDEPAEVLYAKIQAEKQKLIKEGKIKKDKPLPPITDDEIPFAIPSTWKWVRLGDIIFKLTDGTHSTPKYTNQGVPFISVKDLSSGYINFSNTKFISEEEHKILSARCNPEKGDLLLTKVGTTGIPVIVDTDREFSLFVSVALVKLSKSNINLDFLKLLILSPLVQEQVAENTKGVGNKNWVIKDIANTFFPLPPLTEQHRIVAKVTELMQYCEKLKS